MFFISSYKVFSFVIYLSFFPDFLHHVEKGLDKKTKVNFHIYDITTLLSKQL